MSDKNLLWSGGHHWSSFGIHGEVSAGLAAAIGEAADLAAEAHA